MDQALFCPHLVVFLPEHKGQAFQHRTLYPSGFAPI